MRILVTGGAGFIVAHIVIVLARAVPKGRVIALDSLFARGAILALPRLRAGGVAFLHGDARAPEDLAEAGAVDLLVDCSGAGGADAGYGAWPCRLVNGEVVGPLHCQEHVRRHGGDMIHLSTSRVYPIAALRALPLVQAGERLALAPGAKGQGFSEAGITEDFPLAGRRSLQGATRLAEELLIEEYRALYGLRAVIDRCGVVAGRRQIPKSSGCRRTRAAPATAS